MFNESQSQEIKTIAERNIKLNLSDADCERLSLKAGEVNMTIGELLESFIGDLVCGTYSNGSDERSYANGWFNRCGFEMMAEKTFLSYLITQELYQEYEEYKECIRSNVEDCKAFQKDADNSSEWKEIVRSKYVDGKSIIEPAYNSEEEYIIECIDSIQELKTDNKRYKERMEEIWNDYLQWTDIKEPNKEEQITLYEKWLDNHDSMYDYRIDQVELAVYKKLFGERLGELKETHGYYRMLEILGVENK